MNESKKKESVVIRKFDCFSVGEREELRYLLSFYIPFDLHKLAWRQEWEDLIAENP